jgi:hypothetical protein
VHTVSGIIYEIRRKPWSNAQKGTSGDFIYFKLEISRSFYRKNTDGTESLVTVKEIPEFRLGWGVSFDEYSEGDFVEVTFSLRGKYVEYKDKVTGAPKKIFINESEVSYMKFGILESGQQATGHKPPAPKSADVAENEKTFKDINPADFNDDDALPF